jgi:nitroimidazol reductase NimA-like FMN-containing flavoprotein (pyridoxamine 5'-phosphate oxidase superfamily)
VNREGWPVGVIMSYVYRDGRFWCTAARHRKRVRAIEREPRVAVCVTSTGTRLPRNKTVTYKGLATVHDDANVKAWFFPALAAAVRPGDEIGQRQFAAFLDSPGRVVIEVVPTQRIGFDGAKMRQATDESLTQRRPR